MLTISSQDSSTSVDVSRHGIPSRIDGGMPCRSVVHACSCDSRPREECKSRIHTGSVKGQPSCTCGDDGLGQCHRQDDKILRSNAKYFTKGLNVCTDVVYVNDMCDRADKLIELANGVTCKCPDTCHAFHHRFPCNCTLEQYYSQGRYHFVHTYCKRYGHHRVSKHAVVKNS